MNFTLHNLKPYSARMGLYTLLVVLSVVFTMSTALSVADFLKILFGEGEKAMPSINLVAQALDGLYRWLITFGRKEALILFSVIIFVLYSLKNIFGYLSAVQIAVIRTGVVRDLRNKLFRKAMRLPLSYYDRARKGDVMARFSSDMVEYEESVLGSLQSLLSSTISMVLYLAMLVYLNVKLTLFVLLMLPLVALVVAGIARRLKRSSQVVQEMNSRLISLTDETMGGLKVIKSYNASDYTRRRNAMYRRIDAASPVSEFLGSVIVIGILLFGSWLVMNGDNGLTADLFISYVMLFVLMIPPAKDLTTAFSQMRKGRACADRIEAFLGEEEEAWAAGGVHREAAGTEESATAVELRHVNFSYNDDTPVLHDINISVPRGTTLALVGASGSGKSTIADLICRFYECRDGEILLNGQPVGDMPLHPALQRHRGGQHSLRTARRHRGRHRTRRPRRAGPRLHKRHARGLQHLHRRRRRHAQRRPAPAHKHSPRPAPRTRAADPRRGHLGPRHRERAHAASHTGRGAAGPHGNSHRPPPLHSGRRRQHRGARPRPHRGTRHTRRTHGTRRAL